VEPTKALSPPEQTGVQVAEMAAYRVAAAQVALRQAVSLEQVALAQEARDLFVRASSILGRVLLAA
jgi:hypothetical protein